jgi:hypothetical protein
MNEFWFFWGGLISFFWPLIIIGLILGIIIVFLRRASAKNIRGKNPDTPDMSDPSAKQEPAPVRQGRPVYEIKHP